MTATLTLTPIELLLRAVPLMNGIQEVGGANCGIAVELMQKTTGGKKGDPWCADAVAYAGHTLFGTEWPLPLTGGCDELLAFGTKHSIVHDTPAPGAVFLLCKTATDAVHAGICGQLVTPAPGFHTWEGNSNDAGGREGYRYLSRIRGDAKDSALHAGYHYKFIYWWEL